MSKYASAESRRLLPPTQLLRACFCIGALIFCFSACTKKVVEADSAPEFSTKKISTSEKLSSRKTAFERSLPDEFSLPEANDFVARRILKDYGAIFAARGEIVLPPGVFFENSDDCANWQKEVPTAKEMFGAVEIELQTAAMNALTAARDEMRAKGLNITARGTWGARRDYADTEEIWLTRVKPALNYWKSRGKLSATEADRILALAPSAQIAEVLQLEEKGMFFSKDFSKSVLYSATPPGASQHLSMLALDINENGNSAVRAILAKHGWFQTVLSDAPHFTYLGAAEKDLPSLGLKKMSQDGRVFWIPE